MLHRGKTARSGAESRPDFVRPRLPASGYFCATRRRRKVHYRRFNLQRRPGPQKRQHRRQRVGAGCDGKSRQGDLADDASRDRRRRAAARRRRRRDRPPGRPPPPARTVARRMPMPRTSMSPASAAAGRTSRRPWQASRWTRSSPTRRANGMSPAVGGIEQREREPRLAGAGRPADQHGAGARQHRRGVDARSFRRSATITSPAAAR